VIPDECKMPDLSDLDLPLKRYLMLTVFVGDRGLNRKQASYRRNFVRLVDKAVAEYQTARGSVIAQIEVTKEDSANVAPTLQFTDHFENCLNALNRLFRQLETMKRKPDNFEISQGTRKSVEANLRGVSAIRNCAEHMEEVIQRGEIEDDQCLAVAVGENGDRAVLGRHEIEFDRIASAIRGLHKIAQELLGELMG
jgi:hypothetical protein